MFGWVQDLHVNYAVQPHLPFPIVHSVLAKNTCTQLISHTHLHMYAIKAFTSEPADTTWYCIVKFRSSLNFCYISMKIPIKTGTRPTMSNPIKLPSISSIPLNHSPNNKIKLPPLNEIIPWCVTNEPTSRHYSLSSSNSNSTSYYGRPPPATAIGLTNHNFPSEGAVMYQSKSVTTSPETKKKEIKRRTRTGCLTCRKRRIKCDERKPYCLNCEKSRKDCLGYESRLQGRRGGSR